MPRDTNSGSAERPRTMRPRSSSCPSAVETEARLGRRYVKRVWPRSGGSAAPWLPCGVPTRVR